MSGVLQEQTVNVSGTITDAATGEPVMGAFVRIVGGKANAMTDANGKFSLKVPVGAKLSISYIGYKTQEVAFDPANPVVNVALQEASNDLGEAVVVGYGTQRKVNLTGAVATIDSKELQNRPIQNVQQGLQGMMAGVAVSSTNGAPGMDAGSINVRGIGTFNNSSPYILVDGVETGTLSSIDPNDIESISVLKDASSAAIYGSKAANGVILVTTKKGKSGKPTVSYNGYVSFQNAIGTIDRLSSYDYAHMYNDALESEGSAPRFTSEEEIQALPNTDWYDLAYKTAVMQHHNVSINGGNDYARYNGSVGYLKQDGILPNAGREQFNGRLNLEADVAKNLTANLNLAYVKNNYTDANNSYVGGGSDQLIRQLNLIAPWIVARYPDGTWGTIADGSPIAWLDQGLKVHRDNTNFSGLFGLKYKFLNVLTASANASYVKNSQNYYEFQKQYAYNENKTASPNKLDERVYNWDRSTFEAMLNYDQTFGRHNVKALLGWHAESYNYKYWKLTRQNFASNDLTDINAGASATQTNEGYTRRLNMLSWFARVNYDFAGKYLFEANVRSDGSSRFSDGHRWGTFPSFSAGWRISEEPFMENTRGWLSNLKLRGSWGMLGNQEAFSDYYPSINVYSLGASAVFDGQLYNGYYQGSYKVTDLTWEKSTTWGVGLDLGILNNKVTLSLDYYNRLTKDILMTVDAPYEFALGSYIDNVGEMRNNGLEVTAAYNDRKGDWTWGASLNLAYNKNKILKMTDKGYIDGGYNVRNQVGQEFGAYYLYEADGFFATDEEAKQYQDFYWPADGSKGANTFSQDFKAGDLKYVDVNGDGKINADDKKFFGSYVPRVTFGLNLNASWKNFDLALFFNGQLHSYRVFDQTEVQGEFSGDATHPSTIWKDSWTYNKKNPKMPRIFTQRNSPSAYRNAPSSFWMLKTSFLRLKNLQFGYRLPQSVLDKIHASNVRVYYSCENLFTIDGMDINIDPEATSGRLSSYPLLRTHSIGLSVTF